MSVEAPNRGEELQTFELQNSKESIWNGRSVSLNQENSNPRIVLCGRYVNGVYQELKPKGLFWEYFDSEEKKKNKFDIALYQYHIKCNNEESKKALESSFEKMATGMVGVIVGVACFIASPKASVMTIYHCGQRVWMGVEDFKKAMETAGTPLDDVLFVTWYDDYEKNTNDLVQETILEPWKPLDTSGFELMDKQYERKKLDPSFQPWVSA